MRRSIKRAQLRAAQKEQVQVQDVALSELHYTQLQKLAKAKGLRYVGVSREALIASLGAEWAL